ncbi:MAG: hypothetical protein ACKN89_02120 [Cyanobium sp.]
MPETAVASTDLDLISVLRAIPDPRMPGGIRIPAWSLLLVAVLGMSGDTTTEPPGGRGRESSNGRSGANGPG